MKYDPFQLKAIEYINQNHSVIVSAPTGAGKTVIAEHVIKTCLDNNQKVIYTAPIKALSNQKFREFQEDYPNKVGIITGDVSINANAPTLIMTTEIFRNKILEERNSLKDYKWIIFDEIHYLDDDQRGSVWEESLIFLPDHMNILGLSATVPNLNEMARWLQNIHKRPIKIVKETERPVPLHFLFQCQNKTYDSFEKLKKHNNITFQKLSSYHHRHSKSSYVPQNKLSSLMDHLIEKKRLPCIYFVFSRKKCAKLAQDLITYDFLTPSEKKEITHIFEDLCEKFDITGEPNTEVMKTFIQRGIAYHHAGMLPTLKEIIERIFATRLIKIIFTTETFALGINMPAKTVVFDELRKYYNRSFSSLKTRDFYQMAGRAGRRSIDTEGFVYCKTNPKFIKLDEIHRMIYGNPEKVNSKFNATYATILNLYHKHGDKLYDIYPKSFHYFQVRNMARKKAVKYLEAKVNLLKKMNHIKNGQLTEKGFFAGQVYGYELILSELHSQGYLDRLSENDLAILCLAIVFEPRKGTTLPPLSKQTLKLKLLTDDFLQSIHWIEKQFRIKPKSKRCAFHLTPCIEGWIKGEDFQKIITYTEADEGEIVRYFRMCIQILREILESQVNEHLQSRIHNVIRKINRDVVDAEKQLRN